MGDTISVRGVDLAWQVAGDGLPFVWGHGLTSNRAAEDQFGLLNFDAIAESHRVFRYDARGHGESGFTTDPTEYGWEGMALDQLVLADELSVDRYVAAGASLGAATALHAAVQAPDRIEALVLVIPPTGWETRAAQTELYEQMAQIVDAKGTRPLIAAMDDMPQPDPLVGNDLYRQRRVQALEAADPTRLAGLFRGAKTADLPPREDIAAISVPTLVLAWSGDSGHPVSTADQLTELMPNAVTHIASTWDAMRTWTDLTTEFLSGV